MNDIIKCHPSINNIEKASLFKLFSKRKGKRKKKKVLSNPNIILNLNGGIGKAKKVNDPKPKGKYFNYGIVVHWKRNCPIYLSQIKDSGITKSLVI